MNIFYPVKNSSGKKNFPSFFKLFVTLLLCLAGVSVAQAEDWYLRGSFNNTNWAESEDYKFEYKEVGTEDGAVSRYVLDVTFNSAGTDYFKLYWKDKTRWCGQGNVDNALKLEYCSFNIVGDLIWVNESQDSGGNIQFTHNEGTYRFIFDRSTNNLFVTGLVVTINPMTVNNDGYTVFSISYVNANPDKQIPTSTGYVVKFDKVYPGIGQNEEGTLQSGSNAVAGTYTFTSRVIETYANEYTYWGKIMTTNYDAAGSSQGNTYTYSDGVVTETPTKPVIVTDLYIRGVKMGWGEQDDETWKQTSVSEDGNTYTWDWSGSPRSLAADTGNDFKIAAITSGGGWDPSNNYGPSGDAVTLTFENGVATVAVINSGDSKNMKTDEVISKIVLDKSNLTATFYTTEQPTPVFGATITATPGTGNVTLISTLTESVAGTDLTSATCGFQYKVTGAGDDTYAVMTGNDMVSYSGEGATRTAKLSQDMAAGDYVFRAVWTYNSAEVANAVTETVTVQNNCQDLANGFTISGQFNVGVSDGGGLYEGTAVESGDVDPNDGYWSDGARFVQLTANSVAADLFEWQCVGYKIDDNTVETENIPTIAWKDKDKTSARAELSLPGTYTFVCKATCNGVEATSASLTITAPAPEMGFNGNIVTNHDWGTPSWAGQIDGGYMQRVEGRLVWKSNGFTVDGFGDDQAYHFVVEQRYKLLGCVTNEGWTENGECGGSGKDNKINRSTLSFTNVAFNDNTHGYNFIAINNSGWTSGVNGTKLQLVVTMTDYDSYKVELVEYQNTIAVATTDPVDGSWGIVSMKTQDGTVISSGSNVADYVGQKITVTADPVEGYRVQKWVINGTEYVNSNTSYTPTVTEQGLDVVVYFERACNSVYVYEITGGGTICSNGGSTEITMNTLKNTSYQLYKDGDVCGEAVAGTGSKQVWKVTEGGTYTVQGYDTTYPECSSQAVDMTGEVVVTAVDKLNITLTPGSDIALSVLQTRTAKSDVPVDWEISVAVADGGGGAFCNDDNHYLIVSKDDLNIAYKVACLGKATLKATMKAPNNNCSFEATMDYNGTENEVCATIE